LGKGFVDFCPRFPEVECHNSHFNGWPFAAWISTDGFAHGNEALHAMSQPITNQTLDALDVPDGLSRVSQ
jgi:hypothetical protein